MGTSISMALLKASSTDRHVGKISPLSGFDGKNDVLFISILKAPSTVHSQSRRIHFNAWQVKFLSIFYKPETVLRSSRRNNAEEKEAPSCPLWTLQSCLQRLQIKCTGNKQKSEKLHNLFGLSFYFRF